jgi:CBS domain containing-hemolysin-like protein
MDDKPLPRSKTKKSKKKGNTAWIVAAFSMSFAITAVLSAASDKVVDALPVFVAAGVLIGIIFLGILFDIIGLAVATADIGPFNSMAARRLKTGQKAVWLINNAEKVSSFCNDIVGDIAGVVSGATGAGIAVKLFYTFDTDIAFLLTLALTSLISAVTVGGKAAGKSAAIKYSTNIVHAVAKVLCGFRK